MADTCVGGGGRYFILHIEEKDQLAVFDVTTATIANVIPLPSKQVLFAAGMDKLFVVLPDHSRLLRYDLATFALEASDPLPLLPPARVVQVAMGSASDEPLLLRVSAHGGQFGEAVFLNPYTFQQTPANEWVERRRVGFLSHPLRFRASRDGRTFGAWSVQSNPAGMHVITLRDRGVEVSYDHSSNGHVIPGFDDNLYTERVVFAPNLFPLDQPGGSEYDDACLPAVEGPFALFLLRNGLNTQAEVRTTNPVRTVGVIRRIRDVDHIAIDDPLPVDRRYHFAPFANLLAVVPPSRNAIAVHRYDLEASLRAADIDYLYVVSHPPPVTAKRYTYQLVTKSRKGDVRYWLNAGPPGMTVSPTGLLTWTVPDRLTEPIPVILSVTDASDQEIFHRFFLSARPGGVAQTGPASPFEQTPAFSTDAGPSPTPPATRTGSWRPTIPLPETPDATCVGGGGRYVVLRLPKYRPLAVVDVQLARIAKYIPLVRSDALFSAGRSKLFILNPSAGTIERWDFDTFEKEVVTFYPPTWHPTQVGLGHSADGPVCVSGAGVGGTVGTVFLDPVSLRLLNVHAEGKNPAWHFGEAKGKLNVSPDGRVYALGVPTGWQWLTLAGRTVKLQRIGDSLHPGRLVPGPDGTLFDTSRLYTTEWQPVGGRPPSRTRVTTPATSGPWYLSVTYRERPRPRRPVWEATARVTTDEQVAIPLDELNGLLPPYDPLAESPRQSRMNIPLHDRLHLVPQLETLAYVDDAAKCVHLLRVPLRTLLDQTGKPYLFVTSQPPPAVRGMNWEYTPQVWSKSGGVSVKLEAGPPGMTADGKVRWAVPAGYPNDEVVISLTVSDASKRSVHYTFPIPVGDR